MTYGWNESQIYCEGLTGAFVGVFLHADDVTRDPLSSPDGVSIELWDCWRSAINIYSDEGEHPTRVATANDSIYFEIHPQNSEDSWDGCWVRGHIEGDEVTIKSGLEPDNGLDFSSCEYWTRSEYYDEGAHP